MVLHVLRKRGKEISCVFVLHPGLEQFAAVRIFLMIFFLLRFDVKFKVFYLTGTLFGKCNAEIVIGQDV